MNKRIQRKRTKGWRMPENCVYVGRPTIWGNPFTRPDAVEKYEEAISEFPVPQEKMNMWCEAGGNLVTLLILASRNRTSLRKLKGKDLACWCALDKPCHADVLLRIGNEETK